jgi:FkbM family methyltransferase
VILDIGANRGDWSNEAISISRPGRDVRVHAFEPSSPTREILAKRLSGTRGVTIHSYALSNVNGDSIFYSGGTGAGTNSLHEVSGPDREVVLLRRLDSWLSAEGIGALTMVKIDTEGFDFLVLEGAERTLTSGACEIVQFEYNWRWLLNRASLRDVFRLIAGKPYHLGKLIGESIEFYDEWHFELDRYFENNYVLIRKGSPLLALGKRVRFSPSNAPVGAHDGIDTRYS